MTAEASQPALEPGALLLGTDGNLFSKDITNRSSLLSPDQDP